MTDEEIEALADLLCRYDDHPAHIEWREYARYYGEGTCDGHQHLARTIGESDFIREFKARVKEEQREYDTWVCEIHHHEETHLPFQNNWESENEN